MPSRPRAVRRTLTGLVTMVLLAGCGDAAGAGSGPAGTATDAPTSSPPDPIATVASPGGDAGLGPAPPPATPAGAPSADGGSPGEPAGNPDGAADVPAHARAVDTSRPTRTVGDGTPASCTSDAVVSAVAAGGILTFACGPQPVVIVLKQTAKVRNAASRRVVLDGGGLVTLSGGGERRILYMNTCDEAQGWTTSHCNDQDHPELVVQNLTFADGDATGERVDGGGGGAIFVRGGRFRVVDSRFVRNRCDPTGPDLGGAAIRVLDQWQDQPVYVVGSTFGGAPDDGGVCANGGALSSIGVSWIVLNSVLTHNAAVGHGANPAKPGTPGGGSGGAIYADGNRFTVTVAGSVVADNTAKEGGGAIFFVSNDRSGTLEVTGSVLRRNFNDGFATAGYPGIFFLGAGEPVVVSSTLR
ncbi:hypothetical protein O7623_19910 [Solwaraspora sp. WMMD791]|uniref:hypothetical protein n=1 Tax=Solwaraspora sp. WMMD791 TaxID=3016086 RepID=UPI00249A0BDB|nr:hypothetical protein [Solwaraspora sp. WMMD791]WFE25636.1 hypothetical protein O7623_19910 [Solwaraspora sp. WMMD791]